MNRQILGVILLAIGVIAVPAGLLVNEANYLDEGPRCSMAGCSESLLHFYWFVAVVTTVIVVVGLLAA
jgi:hypothetical protein